MGDTRDLNQKCMFTMGMAPWPTKWHRLELASKLYEEVLKPHMF